MWRILQQGLQFRHKAVSNLFFQILGTSAALQGRNVHETGKTSYSSSALGGIELKLMGCNAPISELTSYATLRKSKVPGELLPSTTEEQANSKSRSSLAARQLIFEFRNHGHVYAKSDPLNLRQVSSSVSPLLKASLVLAQHVLGPRNGFWSRPLTDAEKKLLEDAGLYHILSNPHTLIQLDDKQFLPWSGKTIWSSGEILETLRRAYTSKVGVEWIHITWRERQMWIRDHIESAAYLSIDPRTFPYLTSGPSLTIDESEEEIVRLNDVMASENSSLNASEETGTTVDVLEKVMNCAPEVLSPDTDLTEPVYPAKYFSMPRYERLSALTSAVEAEQLELFLNRHFPSSKRFSLEGAEGLIPALRTVLRVACSNGVQHVELGMAHRGRLNVLANVLQKRGELFAHFDDKSMAFSLGDVKYHLGASAELKLCPITFEPQIGHLAFSGPANSCDMRLFENLQEDDEKLSDPEYCKMLTGDPFHSEEANGNQRLHMSVSISANPSHLEWVDPVVLGRCRALQESFEATIEDENLVEKDKGTGKNGLLQKLPSHQPRQEGDRHLPQNEKSQIARKAIMPILVHGDASFCGQGITPETLELSGLSDYRTGGAIHIVVNNQIGFTTSPQRARSGLHCTDVAKVAGAPIFHVNADDIDSILSTVTLALQYRMKYGSSVVIDLVCYRRRGHNEQDDPRITQPKMYEAISKQRPVTAIYADRLVREGILPKDGLAIITKIVQKNLSQEFGSAKNSVVGPRAWLANSWQATALEMAKTGTQSITLAATQTKPFTGVDYHRLRDIMKKLCTLPTSTFAIHPSVKELIQKRLRLFEEKEALNWASAETLAFATLLMEGRSVRLSGQDVQRGTFNQRHAVIIDQNTEEVWVPLKSLATAPEGYEGSLSLQSSSLGRFTASNSALSEAAVLGFEYGYSLVRCNSGDLTLWEAQFGDFMNCAQPIMDCFVSSGETKWFAPTNLVMLLPHGLEGQGPDHSSARLERLLQLIDEDPDHLPGSGARSIYESALGFDLLDVDGVGWIDRDRLRSALVDLRLRCSAPAYFSTLKQVSQALDSSAPTLPRSQKDRKNGDPLYRVHNSPDNSMAISSDELREIVTEEEVDEVFRELDPDETGMISKEAWIAYMRQLAFHNSYRSTNMIIVQPTTPANYFHALRRQSKLSLKPLIVLTPKGLLHHSYCQSKVTELTTGTRFQSVITDDAGCIRNESEPDSVKLFRDEATGQTNFAPRSETSLIHASKVVLAKHKRRSEDSEDDIEDDSTSQPSQFILPPESIPYGWRPHVPQNSNTGEENAIEPLLESILFGESVEDDCAISPNTNGNVSNNNPENNESKIEHTLGRQSDEIESEQLEDTQASHTPPRVRRVIFCTGKIYYTLRNKRDLNASLKEQIVLVRLEQLAPFPFTEVAAVVSRYPSAELIWVQNEPKNMGAWPYAQRRIHSAIKAADSLLRYSQVGLSQSKDSVNTTHFPIFVDRSPGALSHRYLRYIGRPPSSVSATGSLYWHNIEEWRILYDAFDLSTSSYSVRTSFLPPSTQRPPYVSKLEQPNTDTSNSSTGLNRNNFPSDTAGSGSPPNYSAMD